MAPRATLILLCLACACGRAELAAGPGDGSITTVVDAGDAGGDAGITTGDAGITDGDAGITSDAGAPDAGVALHAIRAALHLHSAISHDACDGHSRDAGPLESRDQVCIAQLKAALCSARIDFALLTDHPAHMDELPFGQDLLYQDGKGEQLELGPDAMPIANRLPCPDGRTVLLAAGFEGTHTMPLGMRRHLGDPALYHVGTDGTTPLADQEALLTGIHTSGGIYFTAHSEESDLPTSRLQELKTDAMEWYNVHGNFKQLYGGDTIGGGIDLAHVGDLIAALKNLDPFLSGATGDKPAADLVYLELLRAGFPEPGLQKWHDVLGARFVAAGLGNDVHQNVAVAPICKGAVAQAACAALAAALPNVLTALVSGGTLQLNDGERIDSYARVLRWLNNRVLVQGDTVEEVVAALGAGRSYGVFAVFGEPGPFAFWAEQGGARVEMGGNGLAGSAVLHARLPDRPTPELGATWTAADAQRAELRAVLWRTTAAGKVQVAEWRDFGATVDQPVVLPGAYSLEVLLTPRHLDGALGRARSLATSEYRWLLANAIVFR